MRYKLTFVVGLAVGYVLGTRAGRERYEQLKKSARQVAQNPAVRNTAETAAHQGRQYAGKAYHAVADKAVPMRDLAELFARILKVETKSLTPDEVGAHFGWMAMFAGLDMPASSAKTQAELGWKPKEIGVLADLGQRGYFAR